MNAGYNGVFGSHSNKRLSWNLSLRNSILFLSEVLWTSYSNRCTGEHDGVSIDCSLPNHGRGIRQQVRARKTCEQLDSIIHSSALFVGNTNKTYDISVPSVLIVKKIEIEQVLTYPRIVSGPWRECNNFRMPSTHLSQRPLLFPLHLSRKASPYLQYPS